MIQPEPAKIRTILERLYPEIRERTAATGTVVVRKPPARMPLPIRRSHLYRPGFTLGMLVGWIRRHWLLTLLGVATICYASVHVHFYNLLVDLEFDVLQAWAQVEAQLERRHHIQQNLTRIAQDYSTHEREVLLQLTQIREVGALAAGAGLDNGAAMDAPAATAMDDAAVDGSPAGGLPIQFQLTAEEYPELMLSDVFAQFSAAIVGAEDLIAEYTVAYNEAVNEYSTALKQFPTNIFARICGFEDLPYHAPDEDALRFETVEY